MAQPSYEVGPVFDSFDLDLVVKVLSHTAFSEYPAPVTEDVNTNIDRNRPILYVLYPHILLLPGSALAGSGSCFERCLLYTCLCFL